MMNKIFTLLFYLSLFLIFVPKVGRSQNHELEFKSIKDCEVDKIIYFEIGDNLNGFDKANSLIISELMNMGGVKDIKVYNTSEGNHRFLIYTSIVPDVYYVQSVLLQHGFDYLYKHVSKDGVCIGRNDEDNITKNKDISPTGTILNPEANNNNHYRVHRGEKEGVIVDSTKNILLSPAKKKEE